MFCKYPATFPPDISVRKHTEEKAPARSKILSVLLSSKYIQKTYNSWNMVKCGLIEAKIIILSIHLRKECSNLPAGVDTGSFVKEVGGYFV